MDSISLELPPPRTHEGGDQALKKPGGSGHGFHSHLELSLGISSNDQSTFTASSCRSGRGAQLVGGDNNGADHQQLPGFFLPAAINKDDHLAAWHQSSNSKSWLDQAAEAAAALHNGFIHPWSLAARQQKAVFEQALQKPNNNKKFSSPSSSSMTRAGAVALSSLSPPIIGWPPLRALRKSLGGSPSSLRPAADQSMDMNTSDAKKKPRLMGEEDEMDVAELRTAMFVKVNMEGFAVGRKINLKAHDGYHSLSRALCKLFHDFLSNNYLNNSEDRGDAMADDDFILLYEDNEGDQMLVGDIPWKLFVTSVKKLYIAHNPKKVASGKAKILPEASTGTDQ